MKYSNQKERIMAMSKIDAATGCWNWIGTIKGKDDPLRQYGSMVVGSRKNGTRKTVSSHRFSYSLFNGAIPINMFVCHKCDNPRCVNPEHLFLGTRQDNVDDRERKNRNIIKRGQQHGNATLTDEQVGNIKFEYANGERRTVLAGKYKSKLSAIKDIIYNRTWRHILPTQPLT